MNDDLIFEIEDSVVVVDTCSATLAGEMWVFGGQSMDYDRNDMVDHHVILSENYKKFRLLKLRAVN